MLMEDACQDFPIPHNQNETFNKLVSKSAQNYILHGPKRVQLAADLAALQFNCGSYEARSAVMLAINITPKRDCMVLRTKQE